MLRNHFLYNPTVKRKQSNKLVFISVRYVKTTRTRIGPSEKISTIFVECSALKLYLAVVDLNEANRTLLVEIHTPFWYMNRISAVLLQITVTHVTFGPPKPASTWYFSLDMYSEVSATSTTCLIGIELNMVARIIPIMR